MYSESQPSLYLRGIRGVSYVLRTQGVEGFAEYNNWNEMKVFIFQDHKVIIKICDYHFLE